MGEWSSEYRHDGVANELLHGPTEPFGLLSDQGVVQLQEVPNIFRVRSIRPRGEADQIDKQDRDDLALFPGL